MADDVIVYNEHYVAVQMVLRGGKVMGNSSCLQRSVGWQLNGKLLHYVMSRFLLT